MSAAAKTNELFDLLRAACARQFRFNPRRITASMRYVGKEGHGKDLVHVFRDAGTHSQIVLQGTFATLRITHGDKPHWSDAEQEHYRESDAEMDAKIAAKQAEVEFTRNSPLYLTHRAELLSHYKNSPTYVVGGSNPREAAKALIEALAAANDAQLAAFAEHMKSNDAEHLAHLLLAPCHFDLEAILDTASGKADLPTQ
ncbi:MAG TPA: hypothetical protein VLA64_02745 [Azonexus sp.]|nr:hypothetical protein [Azonexus sp.]